MGKMWEVHACDGAPLTFEKEILSLGIEDTNKLSEPDTKGQTLTA